MKTRYYVWALIALISLGFTACVPNIELEGNAWTGNWTYTEDGESYAVEVTMIFTDDKSGTLFLSENYEGDAVGGCLVMPFTYTWEDNRGTVSATLDLPNEWKGRKAKGTYSFSFTMYYTKVEGLVVTSGDIERLFEIPFTSIPFVKRDYATPTTMVGTSWTMDYDDVLEAEEGNDAIQIHYHYQLEFVDANGAVLNLTMNEYGDETTSERWNVNYTYDKGVGRTSVYFEGETVKGGFYMPNNQRMIFSDGVNLLQLSKQ